MMTPEQVMNYKKAAQTMVPMPLRDVVSFLSETLVYCETISPEERVPHVIAVFEIVQAHRKDLFEMRSGLELRQVILGKCIEFRQTGAQYPDMVKACDITEGLIRGMDPPHWSKLPDELEVTFWMPGGRSTPNHHTLTLLPRTYEVRWDRKDGNDPKVYHFRHFYNHYLRHYMPEECDRPALRKASSVDLTHHFWTPEMGGMTLHKLLQSHSKRLNRSPSPSPDVPVVPDAAPVVPAVPAVPVVPVASASVPDVPAVPVVPVAVPAVPDVPVVPVAVPAVPVPPIDQMVDQMTVLLGLCEALPHDQWEPHLRSLFRRARLYGKDLFETPKGYILMKALLAKCVEIRMNPELWGMRIFSDETESVIRALDPPHWSTLADEVQVTFSMPHESQAIQGDLTLLPRTRQVWWDRKDGNEPQVYNLRHFYNHYLRHYMTKEYRDAVGNASLDDMTHYFRVDTNRTLHEWLQTPAEPVAPVAPVAPDLPVSSDEEDYSDMPGLVPVSSDDTDMPDLTAIHSDEALVEGFKNLPEQFEAVFQIGRYKAWGFTLIPQWASDYESPAYRSMALYRGRIMSLYELRNRYLESCSIPRLMKSTPLSLILKAIHLIGRDNVVSDTTLLDVVLSWSPAQMAKIGRFWEKPAAF